MKNTTDFNTTERHQMITRLQQGHKGYEYIQIERQWNPIAVTFLVSSMATIIILLTLSIKGCSDSYKNPPKQLNCQGCHGLKVKMVEYFKTNKVKSPQEMAEAVLKTKNPRLLAAINVGGEKKTPHTAISTGYKNQYSGAWQTADNWGKITKKTSIADQALIAELALETHVSEEKDIIRGLNAYGGESNKTRGQYAYAVLKELQRVP